MSLFDTQDLAEISHPDYPGERLIACRNPALAVERARKRAELLAATDKLLAGIADRVTRGTLAGAGEIGKAVGKVIDKHKMGKHFHTTITDTSFTYRRDQARIDAEAELDGIYVLRTSVDTEHPRPRRDRRGLQEPRQRRTRLPHHQDRPAGDDLVGQRGDRTDDLLHRARRHARRGQAFGEVPGNQIEMVGGDAAALVNLPHRRAGVRLGAAQGGREELHLPALQP